MRAIILSACADPDQANILHSFMISHMSDYFYVGNADSYDSLIDFLNQKTPDIILLDSIFLGKDPETFVRNLRTNYGQLIGFIVIGPEDFQTIYNSIKAGANDYLLSTFSMEELRSSLLRICANIQASIDSSSSKGLYIADSSIDALRTHPLSLKELNSAYNMHFSEGLYQMIFVKFDFPSFEHRSEDNMPVLSEVNEFIRNFFSEDCYDIIFEKKSDGFMVLFNYARELQGNINAKLLELYDRISVLIRSYKFMDITICVSTVIEDPCDIWQIKTQVRDAEWSRMRYGLNKILYWDTENTAIKDQAQSRLDPISGKLQAAIETLNLQNFRAAINEFYSLPITILSSHYARSFVRHQVLSSLYQLYWDTIASFTNPSESYNNISYSLHLCTTFERHHSTLLMLCTDLMEKIAAQSDDQYSQPIVQAIDYVKNNINMPIQLVDAATEVHLSSGYFSFLFKKETGQNFTRFVNDQKNKVANELLRTSNLSISEIAARVGMNDVRAFSKKYHAANGITPSQYRKLHGNKELGYML